MEEGGARQQNVLDNERRLLEVVRSRRGPAPEGLKGIKKMRWEEEERRLVEEERRREMVGTPKEAVAQREEKITLISRAVFAALVLGGATFVSTQL